MKLVLCTTTDNPGDPFNRVVVMFVENDVTLKRLDSLVDDALLFRNYGLTEIALTEGQAHQLKGVVQVVTKQGVNSDNYY